MIGGGQCGGLWLRGRAGAGRDGLAVGQAAQVAAGDEAHVLPLVPLRLEGVNVADPALEAPLQPVDRVSSQAQLSPAYLLLETSGRQTLLRYGAGI